MKLRTTLFFLALGAMPFAAHAQNTKTTKGTAINAPMESESAPNAGEVRPGKGSKMGSSTQAQQETPGNAPSIKPATEKTRISPQTQPPVVAPPRVDGGTTTSTGNRITADDVQNMPGIKPVITNNNDKDGDGRADSYVNWTEQYIEAVGFVVIDEKKFPNPRQARMMATRGAEVVAKANLLEAMQGVKIIRETTVKNLMDVDDVVQARVEGIVKGVTMVDQPKEVDGGMEVRVRMPLYGDNGLAPVAQEAMMRKDPSYKAAVEENQAIAAQATETAPSATAAQATNSTEASPVALNFGGKNFNPSLFPVLKDKGGNVVLDFSKYYNSQSGQFPQYVKLTQQAMKDFGIKGGTVLDAVQNFDGTITVDTTKSEKAAKWATALKSAGKFAVKLLPTLLAFL